MKEKIVLITGAGSGIGKGIAMEIARRGGFVIITDTDKKRLNEVSGLLNKNSHYAHVLDVTDEKSVKELSSQLSNKIDKLDILINNAGIYVASPFEQLEIEKFKKVVEVNLWGAVNCTKHFLPLLKNSNNGKIVNILSDFALFAFPNKVAYCTSKFALRGFTNTLLTEYHKSKIKIIQVYPPAVDTGLVREAESWNNEKKELEVEFWKDNGMKVDKVSKIIVNGIERGKLVIKISFLIRIFDWISRLCPVRIHLIIGKYKHKLKFV